MNWLPLIDQIRNLYLRCDTDDLNAVIERVEKLESDLAAAQVDQRLIEELWERRTEMTEMKAQIKLLREQRDLAEMHHSEISIHADVIIKEASALITRCVESRKASAYWNAVEQFRQFEIRIT